MSTSRCPRWRHGVEGFAGVVLRPPGLERVSVEEHPDPPANFDLSMETGFLEPKCRRIV